MYPSRSPRSNQLYCWRRSRYSQIQAPVNERQLLAFYPAPRVKVFSKSRFLGSFNFYRQLILGEKRDAG